MIGLVRWLGPPVLMGFVWVAVSPIRTEMYVLGAVWFVVLLVIVIRGGIKEDRIERRREAAAVVDHSGLAHQRRLAVLRLRFGRGEPGDEELANAHLAWQQERTALLRMGAP